MTGAASGIGRATALLFGRRGFHVGCYDIDEDGARRVAAEVGPASSFGRLDVTDASSWSKAVAAFDEDIHRMDVLFNCAGLLRMGRFEDIPPDECRKQLDVNVMGVVLGVQASLPLLERTGGAVIVNMSSASALYGQPELAVYSASKFAVRALTQALDVELRQKGVRVCDVMPSYVDTPMVHSQRHTAKTLARLGVKLTAGDVAESVWKAVHGRALHYVPQRSVDLLGRVGGLFPEVGRAVMRRLAKPE